jgi:hypothetical protein
VVSQTTREVWLEEGPFPIYNIDNRGPRSVPYEFTKSATWTIINGVEGYYARSLLEPEVEAGRYYPVEFNFERRCWVEVCPQETEAFGQFWQAHRIAAKDLGFDITEAEVELHHALLIPHINEEDSTHSRSNTPSSLASCPEDIILVRESPIPPSLGDAQIAQLAESRCISDHTQMSQTMPILAQVRVINLETRHMTTECYVLMACSARHELSPDCG